VPCLIEAHCICHVNLYVLMIIIVSPYSPDGNTLIPWRRGRPLTWDVTVCTTVAVSYLTAASHTAGADAEQATDRKCSKYTKLSSTHEFQPVAVESDSTVSFLAELGRRPLRRTIRDPVSLSKS